MTYIEHFKEEYPEEWGAAKARRERELAKPKHKGPGAGRRLLCVLGFHSYKGTEIPHTYQCRYCPDRTGGHL